MIQNLEPSKFTKWDISSISTPTGPHTPQKRSSTYKDPTEKPALQSKKERNANLSSKHLKQ